VQNERAARLVAKFRRVTDERVRRLQTYLDRFEQAQNDPQLVTEIKRELHTIKGEARIVGFPVVSDVAHALEDLFVLVQALGDMGAYREAMSEGLDLFSELVAEKPEQSAEDLEAGAAGFIEEVRMVMAAHTAETQRERVSTQPRSVQPTQARSVQPLQHAHVEGPTPAEAPADVAESAQPRELDASHAVQLIPVSAARLKALTSSAAELAIRQEQLERSVADLERLTQTTTLELELWGRAIARTGATSAAHGPVLRRDVLPKLIAYTREMQSTLARARDELFENQLHLSALQTEVRESRMVSFDDLFQKHARGIRDLARSQGKKLRVTLEERAVAVDKQVLDKVDEALLHIVRNAVDHGIESAAERSGAGKSARAEIKLLAREAGEHVEVIVEDDGRGIDIESVQKVAVERGLVTEQQATELSKQDTIMLLFEPNFSTRDTVSSVSGRGIGLDIVRKQILDLDGSVRVESEAGQGTRFVLRVPISTAFAKALVIKSGKQLYALPVSAVERIVSAEANEIESAGHGEALVSDQARIPIIALQHVLGQTTGDSSRLERALLVLPGPPRIALEVDGLIGQRETLRRNLNAFCAASPLVNGTAVIEGQKLVLFLNVNALSRRSEVTVGVARPVVGEGRATRERGRILFVDDSELTRDMIVSLLQRSGFTVREAVDGSDAWEAIQRDAPDLVLTDLDMPVMDGFALVQRIRSTAKFRELPVIVLSTRGSDQDKRRAMEAGADAYLVKSSMRTEELNKMLGSYLQRGAGR